MTTARDSAPALIEQLAETWTSIEQLAQQFSADDWLTGTACPGWTVADQLSHLIGTESMLAGHPGPPADEAADLADHVRNDIGRSNEQWVVWHRRADPSQVLAEFRTITAERLEQLRSRSDSSWDEPSWTPVGKSTYRRFMQIRVFDSWVHEQDMRTALGKPGHGDGEAAEQSIDEIERALGYIVGKRGGAPDGSRITIVLTGPVHRTMHVAVEGRGQVVEKLGGPADVTLRLSSTTFAGLACGRADPAAAVVEIEGDQELGGQIATHLAFTI
jgi:uncharacterized protein (TIGR03083 family)